MPLKTLSFTNAWVKDLAWLMQGQEDIPIRLPPFKPFQPYPTSITEWEIMSAWLLELDQNPSPIFQHRRLGHYFEDLVAFYLAHNPIFPYQIKARNLQINAENGSTLGELDFIIEGEKQRFHLEVAVKFYLRTTTNGQEQWLGPNAHDSLAQKSARMIQHQLPLGKSQGDLPSLFWLKGILFEPWDANNANAQTRAIPHWLHLNQLNLFLQNSSFAWQKLEKNSWLGGQIASNRKSEFLFDAVKTNLAQHSGVMLCSDETNHRVMVVSDSWPN